MEADLAGSGSPLAAEWNHANQLGSCTPDQLSQRVWSWRSIFYNCAAVIASYYWVGFCSTAKWISHADTMISAFFVFPSRLAHHRAPSGVLCATQKVLKEETIFFLNLPNVQPQRRPTDSGKGTSETSPWKLPIGLAFWKPAQRPCSRFLSQDFTLPSRIKHNFAFLTGSNHAPFLDAFTKRNFYLLSNQIFFC